MKKLVDLRCLVAIGKDEYYDTSLRYHIHYVDVKENANVEYTLNTWEEALEAAKNDKVRGLKVERTLFGNRPYLEVYRGDFHKGNASIYKRTFKPIHVRWECEEILPNTFTMKDLVSLLPADEFCEWMEDHKITKISFQKY